MNKFIFSGNLGKDAIVRSTPNGKQICSFSVPCTQGYGDYEKVSWILCKILGKRAEGKLPSMLTKGTKVIICGEFVLEQWQKDGIDKSMVVVIVNDLEFAGGPQEQQSSQDHPHQGQRQQQSEQGQQATGNRQQAAGFDDFDDDIPF